MTRPEELAETLDSTDPLLRQQALRELADLRRKSGWTPPEVRPWMNLHAHTFHSFNAHGWSPARLVFEAVDAGLEIIGTVDFDVLDGMEETLAAGDLLGIKSVVGLETRVFVPEYADKVLNSPGEPGIAYFMATGCTRLPQPGSAAATTLASFKEIAQKRNREMVARVNDHLDQVRLDYEEDVLPLTPSANPTERHLVRAYIRKAEEVFASHRSSLVDFWSKSLGLPAEKTESLLGNSNLFQDTLRSKLMKRGGVGYASPDPSSFPTLESMIQLGREMGALPTYAYLDGTAEGESDISGLLSFMVEKGVVALNIIPDRNWRLNDPDDKRIKLRNLGLALEAARDENLPLCIGTEMNKAGQRFVDDFDAPELAGFVDDFRGGGRTLWGHTLLARAVDFGWMSPAVERCFGTDRKQRFDFYRYVGNRFRPGRETLERLSESENRIESILEDWEKA